MSINNPIFTKPHTQIFTQQPNNFIDPYNALPFLNEPSFNKKPIAYVLPVEMPLSKDKSVQTESVSNDSSALIDIRDFERSQRMFGMSESRQSAKDPDTSEIALLSSRVNVLQSALEEQRTRNEEVKKLLLVSLSDDLANHFTQLMSDLTSTGDRVSSLICERRMINANADQLSIEANLWKNKFVAGRILVNELAEWKQQFALRYQESLDAIHNLIQERQRIRVHLSLISDQLIFISSHLGLNHSHMTYSNTTDLVDHSLELVKELSHILSRGARWDKAADNTCHSKNIMDYTAGEEGVMEVLANRPNIFADNSTRYVTALSANDQRHLEQMALIICRNCKGDIFVV